MTHPLREAIAAVRYHAEHQDGWVSTRTDDEIKLCDEAERAAAALNALRQRAEWAEVERDRLRDLVRRVLALEGTWEQLKADAKKEGIE